MLRGSCSWNLCCRGNIGRDAVLTVKIIWSCPSFDTFVNSERIYKGDMIAYAPARGVLHEICLVTKLDIPDLDEEKSNDSQLGVSLGDGVFATKGYFVVRRDEKDEE